MGTLLAIIQKQFAGLFSVLSSRAVIIGGPLIADNDAELFDRILKEYDNLIAKRVVYSQIRNLNDTLMRKYTFINNGYKYQEHLNFLIDLRKSTDQLWKELNSKRRNKIRKAMKANVTVKQIMNQIDFQESYDILYKVYQRARLPLPDCQYFNNIFNTAGDNYFFPWGAYYQNKLIGTMYTFVYNKIVYDWYAGANTEFYSKHPNDIIPWEIFKQTKEFGCSLFDFGGAGKPGVPYGVRDYKKKFGGQMVNYGRFEKIHHPGLYNIARFGFWMWRRIKK